MIAPLLIQILFWIGILGLIYVGCGLIIGGLVADDIFGARLRMWLILKGCAVLTVGIIVWRFICELWMVAFTINGTLTSIMNLMKQR